MRPGHRVLRVGFGDLAIELFGLLHSALAQGDRRQTMQGIRIARIRLLARSYSICAAARSPRLKASKPALAGTD
jgi:hypothetical protein